MIPLSAAKALDTYYLEARARLLDLAAILDRIGRGVEADNVSADPRLVRIRQALEILHGEKGSRAERIQQVFSIEYEPGWQG
jgi:hypothetical protein